MSHHEDAMMPYEPGGEEDGQSTAEAALARAEQQLLTMDGVVGLGLSHGPAGDEVIVAYVRTTSDRSTLPKEIDGLSVIGEVTGEIDAQ